MTHNRSFQKEIFPGNQWHWYWQPNTTKQNNIFTWNTKNSPNVTQTHKTTKLSFSRLYHLRPGNAAGIFLQPGSPQPARGSHHGLLVL